MKIKTFLTLAFLFTFLLACKTEQEITFLEKGSPAYKLATKLAEKLPQLDPELTRVVVNTDHFGITSNEVIYNMRNVYGKNAADLNTLSPERLRQEIEKMAHDLALEKLLLLESQKHNIIVSRDKVDSVLQLHYKRAGTRDSFLKELSSLEIDYDYVETDIVDGLTIEELIEHAVYSELVPPSDDELKKRYDESHKILVSFRSIMLGTVGKKEQDVEKLKKQITQIRKEALSGANFEQLVQKYSEDESSKANGGLYKDLQKGMLQADIEDEIFSTGVGKISKIIKTADGLHLVKMESKRDLSFEEFKNREAEIIFITNKSKAYQEYVNNIKNSAGFIFTGL